MISNATDRISKTVVATLAQLAAPDDKVEWEVTILSVPDGEEVECEDCGGTSMSFAAIVGIYLTLRCDESSQLLVVNFHMPLSEASDDDVKTEVEQVWTELAFRRQTLDMPDLSTQG